ncbi:MAG TPA: DUF1365 domain-containing protein [Bryobacteraceae bacterium]|jgi:hypothetical protein|nr:DUF1365 domain-containing protein [Bryobacteraceae bacterium]
MESAFYFGTLRHRRFQPARHEFSYGLFMAFLDIERIPELTCISRFLSYNRWNWASFDERDHFGDPRTPLRQRLADNAAASGLTLPDGRIFLLTHLRYLGYNFNPISFFYCYDSTERLQMVLAEVNNTFGEGHNYWLSPANQRPANKALRYQCPKAMHVSPFMDMQLDYDFVLTPPAERLTAHMNTLEGGHSIFDATLSLERRPWTAKSLMRALARHPWMTAKIIAAIHWEALRLYMKRVPVFTHPARRVPPEVSSHE